MAAATAARLPTLLWSAHLDDDVREVVTAELRRGTPALLVGTPAALVVGLPKLARIALWDAASSANKHRSGARSVAWRDALELSEAAGAELMLLDPLASAELRGAPIRHHQRLPMERPRSALIDLRGESGWPLSTSLVRLLRQVVERDRQAVVISSRRGYASGLACRSCGAVEMCPNCDVALRYYARSGRLRCHRCGHATPKPTACSSCSHQTLEPRAGAGTEWVAEAVAGITRGLNPEARVWVYDRDQRDDLSALHAGATGVLVGTVALLRLPPLPNVSLIALTHGDSLHDHEDVRAEEGALRTLLLLPELATRERRPLLVAQVHHPDHPVWQAWTAADVDAALQHFEARVTERRAAFGYPPARVWARVQLSHRDERKVAEAARVLAAQLKLLGADLIGPAPAAIARSRGLYAYHLFLRAGTDAELAAALAAVPPRMSGGVVVRSDVDPYDLETMLS
jgi:primosomal protein N' (replication factor Y)